MNEPGQHLGLKLVCSSESIRGNFARCNWFPHGVIKEGQFGWHHTQVHISLHAAFNLTHFSEDTQEARYVFNIHQQVNNFYATPIVGWDGSLNYGNIRQSGGAGWLCNGASWDWWLEDTTLPGLCISSRHRAWTGRSILQTAIFPSVFRTQFISFFFSFFIFFLGSIVGEASLPITPLKRGSLWG